MAHDVDDARAAAELLVGIGAIRRRSRRSLGQPWFPAVCFGAITLLSAPLVAAAGVVALAPLWIVVGGLGLVLTGRHYRRRMLSSGVTVRRRHGLAVNLGIFAFCFFGALLGALLGGSDAGLATPIVLVTLGYGLVGLLQHVALPVTLIAPGAVVALAALTRGADPWQVEVIFGGTLILAGAALRTLSPDSRFDGARA